ncbi:2OG-Fe dioxygenase family protein [Sorangium sp. So ce1128]
MEIETSISDRIARQCREAGFSHFTPSFLLDEPGLRALRATYRKLPADPRSSCRTRAHSRLAWRADVGRYELQQHRGYSQSAAYNDLDGGIVRQFEPLSDAFLSSPVFQRLVDLDRCVVDASGLIDRGAYDIGLHQIRYRASVDEPSYSSPLWLHRDDETIVFIHLLDLSPNAIGGDNLVAPNARTISKVLRLERPLESLVVTQSILHAVTPLSSREGAAFRDILLVTFDPLNPAKAASRDGEVG